MIYSRIAGTGLVSAARRCSRNFDLEKMVDTTDEWIRSRTGIERRHIAADGETTVDLAEHAARRALEAAGVAPEDVDFIAFGTTTPDLVFPNCGALLQQRLGCRGVPAFSVETACAGFMYALSIADKYVRCGEAQARAGDRRGDPLAHHRLERPGHGGAVRRRRGRGGAGAARTRRASYSTHLHADGHYKDMLYCGSGVSTGFAPKLAISMTGSEVFKVAVTKLGQAVDEALAANGLDQTALDWLVPHQANIRIIQATAAQARSADGAGDHHGAGPRQYFRGLGAAGARRRRCATGASSAASCCCSRPSAAASPGVRR